MLAGHRGAYRVDDVGAVLGRAAAAVLLDDDEPFLAVDLAGAGHPAALAQARGGALDGALDVLRVVVAAGDDDDVLDTAGDVELLPVGEPEVTGTKERSFPGVEAGPEGLLGGLGAAPVAVRDARPRHPYLADPAVGQRGAGVRVHDDHTLVVEGDAAAGQVARRFAGGRVLGGTRQERRGPQVAVDGLGGRVPGGDHQGGLGQTVGRGVGGGPEAALGEGAREALHGLPAHRLRAVEGDAPGAQVQALPVLFGDLGHREVVGEVRGGARGGAGVGDRAQPAQRPLQERVRRHEGHRVPAVGGGEQAHDQAQVVEGRQPAHHVLVRVAGEELPVHLRDVVHQVAVADHHALGAAGGAGGVLQEREAVAVRAGLAPVAGGGGVEVVDGDPDDVPQRRGVLGEAVDEGDRRGGREDHGGLGVLDDGGQPRQRAHRERRVRRVDRHGDDVGVQAGEERGDVVQSGRAHDQGPLPGGEALLQHRGDRAGPQVQLGVAQGLRLTLAVHEEPEDLLLRVLAEDRAEMVDKRSCVPARHPTVLSVSNVRELMSKTRIVPRFPADYFVCAAPGEEAVGRPGESENLMRKRRSGKRRPVGRRPELPVESRHLPSASNSCRRTVKKQPVQGS